MSVSVVIPTYNGERHLVDSIETVLAQTIPFGELVIVNDGSVDATAKLARAYCDRDARIRLVEQPNGGIAAARNRGLQETDPAHEYVVFLDHDDLWCVNTLEALVEALTSHPEAV